MVLNRASWVYEVYVAMKVVVFLAPFDNFNMGSVVVFFEGIGCTVALAVVVVHGVVTGKI